MALDPEQPGEYLCQVDATISCGACCGLYNVADTSYASLRRTLAYRSKIFDKTPRDVDAILDFAKHIQNVEPGDRPLPDFHHCPYIGLIGKGYLRVGCLLHPLNPKNNGIDFRGLSYYGGMTCRVYFCPSARTLDTGIRKIVKSVAENWYTYGLIITENRLLTAFFEQIQSRIQVPVDAETVAANPRLVASFRRLFQLKLNWPFKDKNHPYIGHYFFNDAICTRPKINYGATGSTCSPYDAIFQELVSVFNSREELVDAERMLDHLFSDIARQYR